VEPVGPLSDVQFAAPEVDVFPAQPAQLGRPQTGEDRGQQQRPPASVQAIDDRPHFVGGRDIHADLELALLALVGTPILAAAAARVQASYDVLRDQPAFLGIGENGAERADCLAHHGWRAILVQPILESAHHWHGQVRELHRPDQGRNVQVEMVPVIHQRRAFQIGRFRAPDPLLAGLSDRDALAPGGVRARLHVHGDGGVIGVGVALVGERLEMAAAVLIDVVDDPCRLVFVLRGLPTTFADRHGMFLVATM
jgi:hypothetical protein